MSLPEKTFCVWANVPYIVHVQATSKEEAKLKALAEDAWVECEGYEIKEEDVYDVAVLDENGMPNYDGRK